MVTPPVRTRGRSGYDGDKPREGQDRYTTNPTGGPARYDPAMPGYGTKPGTNIPVADKDGDKVRKQQAEDREKERQRKLNRLYDKGSHRP